MECSVCLGLLSEPADCDSPIPEKLQKTSPESEQSKVRVLDQGRQLCSILCGHVFHTKCALFWLKTAGINGASGCPICREKYQENNLRVVYLPSEETVTMKLMKRVNDLLEENAELKKKLEDHKKVVCSTKKQEDQNQNNEKKQDGTKWWYSWITMNDS